MGGSSTSTRSEGRGRRPPPCRATPRAWPAQWCAAGRARSESRGASTCHAITRGSPSRCAIRRHLGEPVSRRPRGRRRAPSALAIDSAGDALLAYHVATSATHLNRGGGIAVARHRPAGPSRGRPSSIGRCGARGRARARRHGDRRLGARPRRVRRWWTPVAASARSTDCLARLGHLARRGRRPGRSGDARVLVWPPARSARGGARPPAPHDATTRSAAAPSRRSPRSPRRRTSCVRSASRPTTATR